MLGLVKMLTAVAFKMIACNYSITFSCHCLPTRRQSVHEVDCDCGPLKVDCSHYTIRLENGGYLVFVLRSLDHLPKTAGSYINGKCIHIFLMFCLV